MTTTTIDGKVMSFPDRLANAVRAHGPLCVGLDPRLPSLPDAVRSRASTPAAAVEAFCSRVLELVRPFTGVIKPQAAFFEQLGPDGMRVLQAVLARARDLGFVTILDAKRGDIASTAVAYAEAAFGDPWHADALTVNPYLGEDAVEPFITAARAHQAGLFVLVRTSNPGSGLFQNLISDGLPLYRHVAAAVGRWNAAGIGQHGLGDVGAVVGATQVAELRELRMALPQVWFLVPGYGAQGGSAEDIRQAYRDDGLGVIVNSSRGVTFPFEPADPEWESRIAAAAQHAAEHLRPR